MGWEEDARTAFRGVREFRAFARASHFLSRIAGVALAALFLCLLFPVASDTKPANRTLASVSPAFSAHEEAAIKRRAKARIDRLIRLAAEKKKSTVKQDSAPKPKVDKPKVKAKPKAKAKPKKKASPPARRAPATTGRATTKKKKKKTTPPATTAPPVIKAPVIKKRAKPPATQTVPRAPVQTTPAVPRPPVQTTAPTIKGPIKGGKTPGAITTPIAPGGKSPGVITTPIVPGGKAPGSPPAGSEQTGGGSPCPPGMISSGGGCSPTQATIAPPPAPPTGPPGGPDASACKKDPNAPGCGGSQPPPGTTITPPADGGGQITIQSKCQLQPQLPECQGPQPPADSGGQITVPNRCQLQPYLPECRGQRPGQTGCPDGQKLVGGKCQDGSSQPSPAPQADTAGTPPVPDFVPSPTEEPLPILDPPMPIIDPNTGEVTGCGGGQILHLDGTCGQVCGTDESTGNRLYYKDGACALSCPPPYLALGKECIPRDILPAVEYDDYVTACVESAVPGYQPGGNSSYPGVSSEQLSDIIKICQGSVDGNCMNLAVSGAFQDPSLGAEDFAFCRGRTSPIGCREGEVLVSLDKNYCYGGGTHAICSNPDSYSGQHAEAFINQFCNRGPITGLVPLVPLPTAPAADGTAASCPAGQVLLGGFCINTTGLVPVPFPADGTPPTCPAGQVLLGGFCINTTGLVPLDPLPIVPPADDDNRADCEEATYDEFRCNAFCKYNPGDPICQEAPPPPPPPVDPICVQNPYLPICNPDRGDEDPRDPPPVVREPPPPGGPGTGVVKPGLRTAAKGKGRVAVVVDIGEYKYRDIPIMPLARQNAEAVLDLLKREFRLSDDRILEISNPKLRDLVRAFQTGDTPEQQLRDLLVRFNPAEVIVYITGHGFALDGTDDALLLPVDADPEDLVETSYRLSGLFKALLALEIRRLQLYLETSFNQALGAVPGPGFGKPEPVRLMPDIEPKERWRIRRWVTFAAAQGDGPTLDPTQGPVSAFTQSVVQGLRGWADVRVKGYKNGLVTAGELITFARTQLTKAMKIRGGGTQTPQLYGSQRQILHRYAATRPAPVAAPPAGVVKPSFNCTKARTKAEKAICANPAIATLDNVMVGLYKKARATSKRAARNALAAQQKQWIKHRNTCGSDVACLSQRYGERILQLQ